MITFSGIDCSGKSTQIDIIKKYYDDKGIKCRVIWSRGGYTAWVEGIKNIVRKDKNYSEEEKTLYRKEIVNNSRKSKLLLWASIADLVRFYGIVFHWIEFMGTTIICDRYIWDTYIDFKLKFNGIDFEKWVIWKILIKCMKKPEKSIIFVIPAEESMRRSELKVEPFPETYEERVIRINKYLEEIDNGRWDHVINSECSIEGVTEQVISTLEEKR